MAKTAKKRSRTKREKRNVPSGIIHIQRKEAEPRGKRGMSPLELSISNLPLIIPL